MITEKDLLDTLAEETKADYQVDGEYTVSMYCAEMNKRGLDMATNPAVRVLSKLVKDGKWTVRFGRTFSGKQSRLYRPVIV